MHIIYFYAFIVTKNKSSMAWHHGWAVKMPPKTVGTLAIGIRHDVRRQPYYGSTTPSSTYQY